MAAASLSQVLIGMVILITLLLALMSVIKDDIYILPLEEMLSSINYLLTGMKTLTLSRVSSMRLSQVPTAYQSWGQLCEKTPAYFNKL